MRVANELQSLSLLFQNKLFWIPDYQRGYAWQQPQLVDFWDDLISLQEGRYHCAPSYAMVLYLAALYDISLDSTYLDEIRSIRTKEDWILNNKIDQVLKDRGNT